ncbi:MAG: SAM hydroxide adenosyltransferase [Verrucomicrobiota bacterium]
MKHGYVASFLLLLVLTARAEVQLYEGELDGAPYKVASPAEWQTGSVFFIVHGWRPPEAPHIADLDLNDPLVSKLLDSGWVVARTAFKENGVDHDAHTDALEKLKAWIHEEVGPVTRVIMEGESTAGTLVLRIAERHPELANGVIALSSYIELDDEDSGDFLTAQPQVPAILMSNLTEIQGPVGYAALAANAPIAPSLRPVRRPGHVNLNWVERWEAAKAMEIWLAEGKSALIEDGSRQVPIRTTGTLTEKGALLNKVTAVNPFYGNAVLGFHPDELKAAGLKQGSAFKMEAHGKSWSVFYGESYGDVPLGEWIAFPNADDQILVARNHESAIETASLKVGDSVTLRPGSE